ncbi:hypothetical protein SAY86_020129 [Trapa natans]|uniref:Pentatricopeptide repeat-containing protein n=1 Tax=Trapa natans TaxID=22666 RepID=A0AAN7R5A7_TRANT|nr:hypothetical protein SAY86_020129 [Trapa natans]
MIIPARLVSLRAAGIGGLYAPSGFRSLLPVGGAMRIAMRDRSLNRRPLQRGRDLSGEAIQAVQALKRANGRCCHVSLQRALDFNFRRLLKLDMIAVLRELLRQNECALALEVFEDIRKEHWYRPQVSLYAEAIESLASNGLLDQVKTLYFELRRESGVGLEIESFNSLLRTFTSFSLTELALDCYNFMNEVGCIPEVTSFRILISGLESTGETGALAIIKQDAKTHYGESLEFLQVKEVIEIKLL